jgi:hypothetical protein
MTQFLVFCDRGRAARVLMGTLPTLWKSSAPAGPCMLVCVLSPWELVEMVNRGFSRGFVPKRGVMIAKSGPYHAGLDEYYSCTLARR